VLARASRTLRAFDSAFADRCMVAAQQAWRWLQSRPFKAFTNPNGIRTGEYGDSNGLDERLWAAVEMYHSTGASEYHNYIRANGRGAALSPRGYGWQNVSSFFSQAYLNLPSELSEQTMRSAIQQAWRQRVGDLQQAHAANAYANMMGAKDYYWGSNMTVLDQALTILVYQRLIADPAEDDMRQLAQDNLDYLLGRNPLDKSYVTGHGANSVRSPHHRPSIVAGFGAILPGLLMGGPNPNLEDSIAQSTLQGKPGPLAYIDDAISASTNENTTYWNSLFVLVLAGVAENPARRGGGE
jgi:endoglucanase